MIVSLIRKCGVSTGGRIWVYIYKGNKDRWIQEGERPS